MLKPDKHPLEAAREETIAALGLTDSTPDESYDAIVALLADAMDSPICLLSIVDGERQFFKSNIGLDVNETPRAISFCGHAILQDKDLMVVEDANLDTRFADNPLVMDAPNIRFYAGAVIKAPNNLPVGTVCAIDTEPRELSEKDRMHLLRAKQLMETAISLRSLSRRDHLTGLYNRRHFDDYLDGEWRRAYRHMLPLSVLLFDVDHFKAYNDRFGHQAGDVCLKKISAAAKEVLVRAGDLMARYGGEEFVAVLPATTEAAAQVVGDRIREAIKAQKIQSPLAADAVVTVSVGGGVVTDKGQLVGGPEKLLAVADEALYAAKSAGRDRCLIRELESAGTGAGRPD